MLIKPTFSIMLVLRKGWTSLPQDKWWAFHIDVTLARNPANGEEARKKLAEEGHKARFVEADLTKPPTVRSLRELLAKEHGGIDILINNAGIAFKVGIMECSGGV